MNYFYDIYVNFNDNNLYEFYEWQKKDNIEHLKKIPLHLVSSNTMKDFIKYNPLVEKEFLEKILNKTEYTNNKTIKYATILADSKTALVVEFNDLGETLFKSKLLLSDDLNIIEIVHNIKRTDINYQVQKINKKINPVLRQEQEIKQFLSIEIETLYKNNETSKLKYLYYELNNKRCKDIEKIYSYFKNKLSEEITQDLFKIYELIKLSYKTNR